MNITIISDCRDDNSFGRTSSRTSSLFNCNVNTVGVGNYAELEASGNLIDVIDGFEDREGVILVNSAPRHGKGKKWENGTPFGFFHFKNLLIVSTIDGLTLSLAKKLEIINELFITDLPTVINFIVEKGLLDFEIGEEIKSSQFRSFDYQPRLAKWLWDKIEIPRINYSLQNIEDCENKIWLIDEFGNVKTTLLISDINLENNVIKTRFGNFNFYNRLKDVPNDEEAIIIGSSGLHKKRFLELVIQGKNFAEKYNLKVGDSII